MRTITEQEDVDNIRREVDALVDKMYELYQGMTGDAQQHMYNARARLIQADSDIVAINIPNGGDIHLVEQNRQSITEDLGRMCNNGEKIRSIKLYRAIYGVSLTDAKNAVEEAAEAMRRESTW